MATAAEATLIAAVATAEGVRQTPKAAALATFTAAGFTPAALATYKTALVAADTAYITAVNSAVSTAGIDYMGMPALFGSNSGTVAT